MKKTIIFTLTLILTPVLAGLYGILHDQFTYTISHEYFTKFKFYQFGFIDRGTEAILPNQRLSVALVGFMATWWTGVFIGIANALTGLIHKNAATMQRAIINATFITMVITAITGLAGLAYGKFYLANVGVSWWLPDNLIDKKAFIMVGSMHNFSYLGGVIGLFAGVIYQVVLRVKSKDIAR